MAGTGKTLQHRPGARLRLLVGMGLPALLCWLLCCSSEALAAGTVAPTESAAPAPVPGKMRLVLQYIHGPSPFALVSERIHVRGILTPFVAGQKVVVSFSRDGRRVLSRSVPVKSLGNETGQFQIAYSSPRPGVIRASAAHTASGELSAFSAKPLKLRVIVGDLSEGAQGESVRLLQSKLAALHFAVPRTGVFDEATGRAVVAYRKMTGLARVPSTDADVFKLLRRGAGAFHVRYRHDGKHVEADLTRQVLAEIEPGGRVRRIYTISSGKPSTPTVLGHYQVYSRTPGVNSEGMVDSSYFIRGYAIHGYAEVPTYAASHGCLRVPVPDALAIYGWVELGTIVDVYYE